MSLWESFRVGLGAIATNRLRSFLTMLGIIIGVASVITMVAVGVGAQKQIAEQIRALGANVLMIYAVAGADSGSAEGRARRALSEPDVEAIIEEVLHVTAAAPFAWSSGRVIRGNRNAWAVLWGTTADYFRVQTWPLAEGRTFLPEEEARAGKVVIIGANTARRLFVDESPVGAEVRILNVPFQVIGVLAERGSSAGDRNQDNAAYMPIATMKRRLSGDQDAAANAAAELVVQRDLVEYIAVKVSSEDHLHMAREEIDALLRQRHRVEPGRPAGFGIGHPAAELAAKESTATTFAWLMASVASVSLIVGGISIMNIMLVSVTERTREIGLRMALGARRRDIRNQFLMEAVSLCLVGGLIGLAIGIGAAVAIGSAAGWPIFVGPDAVAAAVGFAAAVGIFFGWYPARKAARLEPVEALRSG